MKKAEISIKKAKIRSALDSLTPLSKPEPTTAFEIEMKKMQV